MFVHYLRCDSSLVTGKVMIYYIKETEERGSCQIYGMEDGKATKYFDPLSYQKAFDKATELNHLEGVIEKYSANPIPTLNDKV